MGDFDNISEIWFASVLENDDYLVMDIQLPKSTSYPPNKDCILDFNTARTYNKT